MGRTRALLTDTDRKQITGEEGADRRYQSATRIRRRVEELERDAEILSEHHPELLEELREAFGATEGGRLKRLSKDIGEPITVGNRVYEDGDVHELATDGGEDSEDEEENTAASPDADEGGPAGARDEEQTEDKEDDSE